MRYFAIFALLFAVFLSGQESMAATEASLEACGSDPMLLDEEGNPLFFDKKGKRKNINAPLEYRDGKYMCKCIINRCMKYENRRCRCKGKSEKKLGKMETKKFVGRCVNIFRDQPDLNASNNMITNFREGTGSSDKDSITCATDNTSKKVFEGEWRELTMECTNWSVARNKKVNLVVQCE